MMAEQKETNVPLATILTLAFHGLLLLLFVLIVFHTPIPPYPSVGGGSGLEVNLGNTENGMGNNNSEELIPISTHDISNSSDDNYITQDKEDAIALNNKDKNKNVTHNDVVKINDPVVNPNALYKKRSGDGTTNTPGNQGKETGDLNSTGYKGNGGSGGGPGTGNGTGDGPGTGPGSGPGNGISYAMKDRTAKSIPKPNYNSKEEGLVVVNIWVDKNGNVTKAQAGGRGTTTTSTALWKLAEDAARRSKFNAKANAPEEQKGTITYNFINLN